MSVLEAVTLTVVVLVLLGWYLSYTAARLHRLHTRVEGALAALDAQLVRRAEAAVELANSGALDPATSLLLADAATDCLDAGAEEMTSRDWTEGNLAQREALESSLTETIRHATQPEHPSGGVPGDPVAGDDEAAAAGAPGDPADALFARLRDTGRRVQLARRFYNDAVTDVRRLRRHPVVVTFHLAGHAALPRGADFDDGSKARVGPH